jgi:acyl dehydratase
MRSVKYEELAALAGEEIGVSDWFHVTQDRVDQFAEITGDHHWIHVDVERAEREMGGTIAHGWLTVSLIPVLGLGLLQIEDMSRRINYGCDKVRFTNPVRVGKRIRLRQTLGSVTPKAGGLQLKNLNTVEIEGGERPACIAETLSLVYGPGAPPLV